MSKQSSVDFMINILIEKGYAGVLDEDEIEQAKAIHKQEIMQTYSDGLGNGMHFERGDGSGKDLDEEEYYKDNFA